MLTRNGPFRFRLLLAGLAAALPAPAWSCLPPPVPPPTPTRAQIERAAWSTLAQAGAIVEATLLRSPRLRRRGETESPPPGLLRVDRVLRGEAPTFLLLPLADPCEQSYRNVGERGLVPLTPSGKPYPDFTPDPLAARIRAILVESSRRQPR